MGVQILIYNIPFSKRKYIFVATVSTDSAGFVATLPVNPSIFGDVVLVH